MNEVLDEKSKLPVFAPDEMIEELTGYKLPSKQIEWLNSRNYPFELTGANYPKVLMEVVLHRMGSPSVKFVETKQDRQWKPDYTTITQGNTS